MINPTGCCWTLGLFDIAFVEEAVQGQDEAVTVGRVHEALEKSIGGVLGLGGGRGRIRVVGEVRAGRPKRTLTQKILGSNVAVIRGEDG